MATLEAKSLEFSEDKLLAGRDHAPPRACVIIVDWLHIFCGLSLIVAFLLGALQFSAGVTSLDGTPWLSYAFCIAGVATAISNFINVGILAATPPERGGGSRGCLRAATLFFGGVLFALGSFTNPNCITNVTYLFSKEACPESGMGNSGSYAWNAVCHYAMATFMVAPLVDYGTALKTSKHHLASPFWGSTTIIVGGWVIGVFKFFLPLLCGGFDPHQNDAGLDFKAPVFAWTWTWWLALLGSCFLALGFVIFAIVNGSICCRSQSSS